MRDSFPSFISNLNNFKTLLIMELYMLLKTLLFTFIKRGKNDTKTVISISK